MRMIVRWRCTAMLLAIGSGLSSVAAAQLLEIAEGVHYQVIDPPVAATAEPGQIEVTELFWYGCPRCAELEPMMTSWGNYLRGDLALTRSPVVWHEIMRTHARIFYVAERLRVLQDVHAAAFKAIAEHDQPLQMEPRIEAQVAAHGVDAQGFSEAWNHPEVLAAVDDAAQRTKAYVAEQLPALIVNGRYRVSLNEAVPTLDEMVISVNLLIRQLREVRRSD